MRVFWGSLLVTLSMFSFEPVYSDEPWDTTYLLKLDPNKVTLSDLEKHAHYVQDRYKKYSEVEGVLWQPSRASKEPENPTHYGSGGDSALFTGLYAAGAAFRYRVTLDEKDLDQVLESARGLHILTHITGTAGVVARCAFPEAQKEKWVYPDAWGGRIEEGFVGTGPDNIPDILNPAKNYPKMIFYTRATRDQVTGVIFGLGVTLKLLDPVMTRFPDAHLEKIEKARQVLVATTESVWWHLRKHGFKIRDARGKNDTTSDTISGLVMVQLLGAYREATRVKAEHSKRPDDQKRYQRIREKYIEAFNSYFRFGGSAADAFNGFSNYFQYYAWNLRFARSFAIWILEDNHPRKEVVAEFIENKLWEHVSEHQNTFFGFIFNATRSKITDRDRLDESIFALKAHSLRPLRTWSSPLHGKERAPNLFEVMIGRTAPYVLPTHLREPTTYFIWQSPPWEVDKDVPGSEGGWNREAWAENAGLDFILPYWMGRFFGFISAQ